MNRFEDLLKSLSDLIGTPLAPDSKSTCLLVFDHDVKVQLELDKTSEWLIVGASLGEVPPGKYREQVICEALKHNRSPENGIFAYALRKNQLVLFEKWPYDQVQVPQLFALLKALVEKAKPWKEALARGDRPPSLVPTTGSGTLFGLKP